MNWQNRDSKIRQLTTSPLADDLLYQLNLLARMERTSNQLFIPVITNAPVQLSNVSSSNVISIL
jgi:hypothetical protein